MEDCAVWEQLRYQIYTFGPDTHISLGPKPHIPLPDTLCDLTRLQGPASSSVTVLSVVICKMGTIMVLTIVKIKSINTCKVLGAMPSIWNSKMFTFSIIVIMSFNISLLTSRWSPCLVHLSISSDYLKCLGLHKCQINEHVDE